MKKFLFSIIFLLIGFFVSAQTNIIGSLFDDDGPLPMANISLAKYPDTIMVKGTTTDEKGNFKLSNIPKGVYLIKFSYIGYSDAEKKIAITSTNKEFNLGKTLLQAGVTIAGSVVVGQTAPVAIKGDTVEYNPAAYKLQENAVVEDLLKKLPGVQVDKDGSIKSGGKSVTKVLLGGKEFFSNDPTLATKNIPIKIVEKVQVLERKSEQERLTGISDGEEETVINLDIKKGQQQGWMGNINGGTGQDIKNSASNKTRYDENIFLNRFTSTSRFTLMESLNNVNSGRGGRGTFGGGAGNTVGGMGGVDIASYATDKLTIESNGYFAYRNTDIESSSNKQTFLQDSSFFQNSVSKSDAYNRNYNASARITYKPNEFNTIIFRPEGSYSNTDSYILSNSETLDGNDQVVNKNKHQRTNETVSSSYDGRVDYSHNFGKNGRRLSFSAQYGKTDNEIKGKSYSETEYKLLGKTSVTDQLSKTTNDDKNYRMSVSYVEPLFKTIFLQTRYSYSVSNRNQDKNTYSKDAADNYTILDSAYSNSYKNKYIRQRINLSLRIVENKFNLQFGININPQISESTRFIANVEQNKQKRNVTNIGPMARFEYKFTKSHNITLNYRTRTSQPSLSQLDPLKDISNPLKISYGNANLKPSFTHSFEIRYNLNNRSKMSTFMLNLNVETTQNAIVSKSWYNKDGVQEVTYDNANGIWSLNANALVNFPINNYFQLNSYPSARLVKNVSFSNNQKNETKYNIYSPNLGFKFSTSFVDIGVGTTIAFTRTNNSIDSKNNQSVRDFTTNAWTTVYLPWNFTFVSDISYKKSSGYASGYNIRQTVWNAGIEKSVLKNRGTIRFAVNDILRDRKNVTYVSTDNYIQQSMNNTLNCYFMVSFIYRFNVFGGKSMTGSHAPGMIIMGGFH